MSDKDELEAKLQGIRLTLDELEIERNKGTIDIGRYLQLKEELETRKIKLEQENVEQYEEFEHSEDSGIVELFANLAYVLGRERRYAAAIECLEAGSTYALSRVLATGQTESRYKIPEIREALKVAIAQVHPVRSKSLTLDDLPFHKIIQAATNVPLVYLVATQKGSLAFIILPDCTNLDATQCNGLSDFIPVSPNLNSETQAQVGIGVVWLDGFDSKHVTSDYLSKRGVGTDELRRILGAMLETLGEKLISPLAHCLRQLGLECVILIPFGQLSVLPLHAARYEGKAGPCYFLDEFQVTFAPSVQVLSNARARVAQTKGERGKLFSAGNEAYAFAQAEAMAVARIAAASPSPPVQTMFEPIVTPHLLLDRVSSAQYLHLAYNVVVDTSYPLRSIVELSEDTTLALADLVSAERLERMQLVTFSAVQPAQPNVDQSPATGELLPAILLEAGVARVMSNMWLVNDLSTLLLMKQFYTYHFQDGLAPDAALRQAQRWLREEVTAGLAAEICRQRYDALYAQSTPALTQVFDDLTHYDWLPRDDRPFADPIYWAAFIIAGA